MDDHGSIFSRVMNAEHLVRKIDKRLVAISEGSDLHRIEGFHGYKDPEKEKRFYSNLRSIEVEAIKVNKKILNRDTDPFKEFEWIQRSYAHYWSAIGLVLSLLMVFSGFILWYKKTQRYTDRTFKADLAIKEYEIKNLRRLSWRR